MFDTLPTRTTSFAATVLDGEYASVSRDRRWLRRQCPVGDQLRPELCMSLARRRTTVWGTANSQHCDACRDQESWDRP